jgi:hypothetical protein
MVHYKNVVVILAVASVPEVAARRGPRLQCCLAGDADWRRSDACAQEPLSRLKGIKVGSERRCSKPGTFDLDVTRRGAQGLVYGSGGACLSGNGQQGGRGGTREQRRSSPLTEHTCRPII